MWMSVIALGVGLLGSGGLRYDEAAQRWVTPVSVNGGAPRDFAVDTGASLSMVSAAGVDAMGLAVAAPGGMRMATARSLDLAGVELAGEQMAVLAAGHEDARGQALGARTFRGRRLELDFAGGRLRFAEGSQTVAGMTPVAARMVSGLAVIPVVVDGVEALALVDTSGRPSTVNPALARRLAAGDAGERATVGGVTVAGRRIDGVELKVESPAHYRALGLADQPAMTLGADLLSRFGRIAIDYPASEVEIAAAPTP